MRVRNYIRLNIMVLLGDILVLASGFLFAYWLRFNSGIFPAMKGIPHISNYYKILPVLVIIMVFLMRSEKLYFSKARLSMVDEFFTIIKTVTVGIFIFTALTFFYREYSFSRGMLFVAWLVLVIFMSAWRFLVNRIRFTLRKYTQKKRNLLIIGTGAMAERLIGHISGDPHWDYNIKGIIGMSEGVKARIGTIPILGTIDSLGKVMRECDIDEVILTEPEMPRVEVMNIILECEKCMVEFQLVADLLGMVTDEIDMHSIDGLPLLGLKVSPLAEGYNRLVKRLVDIVFSALGLVILLPIFLIICVLIKISSPGQVFYFQKRVGEDGKHFTMIKFRTMVDKAEKGVGPVWTSENDPRRTGLGTFLRRANIDELPQLINVFLGQMSLVGPRPERPHFVGKFKEDIPRYMARHKIKSGMTGWAQVNGLRGNTSIEERTRYDLYYVENWSLVLDFKILLMSIFAIKNAY